MNGGSRPGAVLGLVLVALVSASVAYGLVPFRAAGGIRCSAVLRGSAPQERTTTGFLAGQERRSCRNKGNSRLSIGVITGLVLLVVGSGAVLLPESQMERVLFGEGELPDYRG